MTQSTEKLAWLAAAATTVWLLIAPAPAAKPNKKVIA
jgi:hypothetical protein